MRLAAPSIRIACGFFLTVVLQGCSSEPPSSAGTGAPTAVETDGPPWFQEVGESSGIDFVYHSGHEQAFRIPEIMGGGGALVDIDGDGDLDAYLVEGGFLQPRGRPQPGNRLYRNRGDGSFEEISEGSGAEDRGYGMGVASGDYDGDGRVDLYVTNVGANALLRNLGDGRFEDVTAEAGVGHAGWGASAAFVDHDRDGDLDLFVTNYLDWSPSREIDCYNESGWLVYCSPQAYDAPAGDVLYRNDGNGSFTDVSEEAGIAGSPGTGLGVACADFNGDGWTDVFVANDGMPDHLWINQKGGRFEDEALIAGCAIDQDGRAKAGMGVTVADIDDDGDPDLLVCNLRQESDSLFLNDGGMFFDATATYRLAMVSQPFTRFGMAWVDFDNDGRLDLYQANGRVIRQSSSYTDDLYAEPNLLFQNTGDAFEEVRPRGGTAEPLYGTSRAAAFGDVDNDGGVDILVVNRDAPAHLLRNVAPDRGGWISFRVHDRTGRSAIGATLTARVGKREVVREVRTAFSYLAANDPRIHLGLGTVTEVRDVRVLWTDGAQTEFGDFEAGSVVELHRP